MRVLLACLALLLAGCVELPMDDMHDDDLPRHTDIRASARAIERPAVPVALVDGVLVVDEVDSFHGDYRLILDDQGVWCEADAGPDPGALGITNVCSLLDLDGGILATQETEIHSFRALLAPELPAQRLVWQLHVDLTYAVENGTDTVRHDSIRRTLDLQPRVLRSTSLDLSPECDRYGPLDSDGRPRIVAELQARNGWPYIALEMGEATISAVETDGEYLLEGNVLRIDGPLGGALNATVWIDADAPIVPQGPNACSPLAALGGYTEHFRLTTGVAGLEPGWSEQLEQDAQFDVWLVP